MDGSTAALVSQKSEHRTGDSNTWPEFVISGLEQLLEAGHLDWLDEVLASSRTRRVINLHDARCDARIKAVRHGLAEARIHEASGGPGCLINPKHRLSIALDQAVAIQADPQDRDADQP